MQGSLQLKFNLPWISGIGIAAMWIPLAPIPMIPVPWIPGVVSSVMPWIPGIIRVVSLMSSMTTVVSPMSIGCCVTSVPVIIMSLPFRQLRGARASCSVAVRPRKVVARGVSLASPGAQIIPACRQTPLILAGQAEYFGIFILYGFVFRFLLAGRRI